jgi:hypothetical protein
MTSAGRDFLHFSLRLLLCYAVLIFPWPGLKQAYGALFRSAANAVVSPLVSTGKVEFVPAQVPNEAWDLEMRMSVPSSSRSWHAEYSSRAWGYLPTAAVIALIVATPIPWRRRIIALASGLLLIHVFIALRVAIAIAYGFSWGTDGEVGILPRAVIEVLLQTVSASPVTSFVAPILVWVLVAFQAGDLRRILRIEEANAHGPTPA